MTREEAIKYLQDIGMRFVPTDQYGDFDDPQPYEEALDMAIEALQREDRLLKSLETNEPLYTEVVRCKDCIHWASAEDYDCEIHSGAFGADDFCSYGERKGGDDE